jgi:hypothetical protein
VLDSIPRRISDQTESTTTEALRQCGPLNVADENESATGGEMRHYATYVPRSVPWEKSQLRERTSEVLGPRIRPTIEALLPHGY